MRKILAMLLSVMMLLTAAVAETSAPYAPETVLPLVANNRPYRDFARGAISSSEDAIEQAKAWLYLPLFVTNFAAKSEAVDWSAMHAEEGWYVTAYMRNTFVWLLMDEQGRVQAYDFDLLGNASLTYDGALPDNLDEAIASYIQRFADLNGFADVADYAREEVTTFGDYAVAVTVRVTLDGTPYRFTMRLDMMAFTSVENANLHPTAAQTQRDILLLMRDNLAEKGVDVVQTFFAVQVDDADGETNLTGIASFPADAASDAIREQYGELERYTLHYSGRASEAGIERVELSDWQETTATAQFPLALYALVDGKYLVPDGELAAGTAYLALENKILARMGVVPLEGTTTIRRIRYAREDGTIAESWVSTDELTADITTETPKSEPIPTLESYQITLNGTAYTAFAINKAEKGYDAFADIAGTRMTVVDVLTSAAQGVIAEFGVDASDLLCRTVVEYGYRADKGCWQVDFTIPQRDMADDAYEVEVDDKDGKVTGMWGPQDGNG